MTVPDTVPGLFRAFDAAFPPMTAYPGCQAVLGYIYGPTPHVWTLDEWLRFKDLHQGPIALYNGGRDATAEGHAAAAAAHRLGWRAHASALRIIWLDMELTENPAWIAAWAAAVRADGFEPGDYRSLSSLETGGDPGMVKWIADWDHVQAIEWPLVVGHQYAANAAFGGTEVDLNVFSGSVLKNFGHGPRRLVAA